MERLFYRLGYALPYALWAVGVLIGLRIVAAIFGGW